MPIHSRPTAAPISHTTAAMLKRVYLLICEPRNQGERFFNG